MKHLSAYFLLPAFVFALALPAQAQIIKVPVGQQTAAHQAELPRSGQSKQSVAQEFGEPISKTAAVGTPPISRWTYEKFFVYFEYDHVVHAVFKIQPKGEAANIEQPTR